MPSRRRPLDIKFDHQFDLEAGESKESMARILVERSKLSKSSRVSITKKVKTVEVGLKAVPISKVK